MSLRKFICLHSFESKFTEAIYVMKTSHLLYY